MNRRHAIRHKRFHNCEEATNKKYQPFLSFDGNLVKGNNSIGLIHQDNLRLSPINNDLMPALF